MADKIMHMIPAERSLYYITYTSLDKEPSGLSAYRVVAWASIQYEDEAKERRYGGMLQPMMLDPQRAEPPPVLPEILEHREEYFLFIMVLPSFHTNLRITFPPGMDARDLVTMDVENMEATILRLFEAENLRLQEKKKPTHV